jgi:hypothetical protein
MSKNTREMIAAALDQGNGILRLDPTWVARSFIPSGKRIGLADEAYHVGQRGWITERWIGSTTLAENPVGPPDEGLSDLRLPDDTRWSLKAAVESAGDLIMGDEYAQTHSGLGRLAKILDYADRISFHYHQDEASAALVGCNPKEEAYYFLEDTDPGPRPETFFGVHPSIVEQQNYEILLPHLVDWKDDTILKHSRAYRQIPGEGFHVPAGVLHAPGTALTLELQEDSDVYAVLQAASGGQVNPKDILFQFIRPEDQAQHGERIILDQINWPVSGDPYFYENYRTMPQSVQAAPQDGGQEYWIFYNTAKFSGKKLVVKPGQHFTSRDRGVYNLLVWRGQGRFDGKPVAAGDFELDELLVSHHRAIEPLLVENTGTADLIIFKFYGPDINPDVPYIPPYPPQKTSRNT